MSATFLGRRTGIILRKKKTGKWKAKKNVRQKEGGNEIRSEIEIKHVKLFSSILVL